jgi:ribosomal protein S18 acetylase RimI-like enzyme
MKKLIIAIEKASPADAEEILKLQKLAYISEAELYDNFNIPPLTQTLEETREDFRNYIILKAVSGGVIIGSVRGQINDEGACYIGRLMVHPDFQNHGLGTRLMNAIEAEFPRVDKFTLGTGQRSERNLYLYHKLGFTDAGYEKVTDSLTIMHLEKTKNRDVKV